MKTVERIMKMEENSYSGIPEIESGVKVMKSIIKKIKSPSDKNSMKEIKESVELLSKKLKLLKTNDQLKAQYLDRTAFDTVQGVFQCLHLYIISTPDKEGIDEAVEWLRDHETAYEIADRMQKAALARADFSGGKK